LTPEMAGNNRKQAVSYSVLIPSIWWHNLGFGEPIQSYSPSSNQPKTPIVRVVETSRVNSINRGGDLGKYGPGPRAKADALKNARKTGGGSIFAQGFTPQRQYCSRPINKPLSCRTTGKLNEQQFNGNQNPGGSSSSLSQSEALAYLEKRYGSNHITVDGDLKISDWQTIKKSCHGVCFGINPQDYGAKQSDLQRLNKIGIVKYVQEGGRLPSDEHIQAIQGALKSFCEDSTSLKNKKSTFRGSPSITYFNEITNQAVIFQRDRDDLITGYKLHPRNVDKYKETANIGELPKK
ncbi:hypothetical protein, partial [uncultured Eudoraea sp.]|uniref:hypothetical protein n=1 Tax=uncultured Eudoraea sp. TaxID=1035614 RepID=UPI00262C4EB5